MHDFTCPEWPHEVFEHLLRNDHVYGNTWRRTTDIEFRIRNSFV
jgi:hypothetical protein